MTLSWLALSACDADLPPVPPLPAPPHDTGDPPLTEAPEPPSSRVLSVGPIFPTAGSQVPISVRPALPGEALVVGWSTRGPGAGPCPPNLRGACFSLLEPVVLDPVVADFSGRVVAAAAIDAPAPGPVWVQGFVVSAEAVLPTDVLERPVWDPPEVWVGDASPDQLGGRRAVTGAVRLERSDATAVSLPELVQVGGDLVLWESPSLAEVSLPALRWIGGDLSLYDDPALSDLDLGSLERVGGTLSVNRMAGMADLDAFGALGVIGGDLYLYHDLALARIDRLDALARIGGGVMLWELAALHTVSMPALFGIGGKLDLFEDDALTTLSMPALAELGSYELHHCDAMADVGRFDALSSVRGAVALRYDVGLRSLSGFARVTTMGALTVSFSNQLTSLADLGALSEVALLDLMQLPALSSVDLPHLARAVVVSVRGNDGLVEVGLPALAEVGDLGFVDNPALSGCAIEALIARASPTGEVVCSGNLADGCTTRCGPEGP